MRFLMILGMVCLLVSAVCAADQPAPAAAAAPTKVSLQFEDVDAGQALITLSQKAQVTILGDVTVKGKVNCGLNDVTTEQALDTICKTNGLEWYKAYIGTVPNEKPNAAKILALLDALKALGNNALICQGPAQQQTAFVPVAEPGTVDLAPMAETLKLKPVYVVRAVPKPIDPAAAKAAANALGKPANDATAAANQLWGYFSQMPVQQQYQVMHEIGNMMRNNMTPEQQDQMRQMWRQNGGQDGGGRWGGNDQGGRGDRGGPPRPN